MPVSNAQKKATQKWESKAYDKVTYRLPKGMKNEIDKHIANSNESANGFVRRAIDEALERDKCTGGDGNVQA